jgi:AraC-like DNA-binding protein
MKIVFEKVVRKPDSSFATVDKRTRAFDGRFHFHPEIEITLIESSSGRRVVGDSIESFAPGDLVLLGANLPHQYISDPASADAMAATTTTTTTAMAKVIQFRPDFMGADFFRLPEFNAVATLLKQSSRGLKFGGETDDEPRQLIRQVFSASGSRRLLLLLELLDVLSRAAHATPIASAGYLGKLSSREGDTIDHALQYLNDRFTERVTLEDLCRYLHVSPATCNRLFQKSIGRSFKAALIEIRISHACRQLLETGRSVVDVAYASGFTNLSNFNRRFKEVKGCSPRRYRDLSVASITTSPASPGSARSLRKSPAGARR